MADPITLSDEMLRTAQTASVYLRERWAASWTAKPYLYVDSASWVASPNVAVAQLSWIYGHGIRQGDSAFGNVAPLDITDWWVKIVFDQGEADDLLWYGFVHEIAKYMDGDLVVSGERVGTGHQTFTCRGMESLLERHIVRAAWCADGSNEYRVHRGLEFNAPNRSDDAGNRSAAQGPRGVYLFTDAFHSANKWSSRNIVNYVLEYHTPLDRTGDEVIRFMAHPDVGLYVPDWDAPRLATHGRTTKHLLDAIMDRRRGLSYTVEVDADTEVVMVRPFTFVDTDISVAGGHILGKNESQKAIDFGRTPDVVSAELRTSSERRWDQIVAFGREVVVCETLGAQAGSITAHWDTAALQTAYNEGAKNEAGYGALSPAEKLRRNTEFRSADKFSRVYSHFGPDDDWDSVADMSLFYDLSEDLGIDHQTDRIFYRPAQRFERYLPLKTDHVYPTAHSGVLTLATVVNNTPDGVSWEYLRPIVAMTLHDDLPDTSGKWALVDKLPVAAEIEGTGDGHGRTFGCSVRMQDDALGFVLNVSGTVQWAIAATDFSTTEQHDYGSALHPLPEYDWKNDLKATVASKADVHVFKAYPETLTTDNEAIRTLYLDASARAGLDIVCNTTMLDIQDGTIVASGGSAYYIRDDRDILEQIARIAGEWYAIERQTLVVTWRHIENAGLFTIGDLITTIGADETEETVRTVITSRRITMAHTVEQFNTLTIETQWVDLDVGSLI